MNGGFEEENICTEYHQNCAPEAWISSSLRSNYYFDDAKSAWDGSHFIGLVFRNPDSKSNGHFIRSRLLCGLRKGSQYRVELMVRSYQSKIDSIGIFFSSKDVIFQKEGIFPESPQLYLVQGLSPTRGRKGTWQRAVFTYTATGDEAFMNIADFSKVPHQFNGVPDILNDYYFFVDAVIMTPIAWQEKMCIDADQVIEREYALNERHGMLEKKWYVGKKNPPPVIPAKVTSYQRIDTLVLPDVLFPTNEYSLSRAARFVLDSFRRASAKRILYIDSLVVEGHTDSVGSAELNKILSLRRARSVAQFLQPHYPPAIQYRGWGSQRPVSPNNTPEGRQLNRRVEIYLYILE